MNECAYNARSYIHPCSGCNDGQPIALEGKDIGFHCLHPEITKIQVHELGRTHFHDHRPEWCPKEKAAQ